MRLYFSNYIQSNTVLTPSSSAANQDVDILKQPHLTSTFDFGSNTANLIIDFLEDKNIGSCVIDIGELTGLGTYTLEGNSSDVWTSPAFSTSLIVTETMLYADVDDEEYRYWRIVFSDSVDIKIGWVQLGAGYLQMPGVSLTTTLSYKSTSSRSLSISGQVYGDLGYQYLETSFDFVNIGETETMFADGTLVAGRVEMLNMWKEVEGVKPIWCILWEKNISLYPPVFCVLNQSSIDFNKEIYKSGGFTYKTKLNIMEVK